MNDEVKNEETTPENNAAASEAGTETTDTTPETTPTSETGNDSLLSILDGNVDAVIAALEGKSPEQLQALLTAEENGNTRKGVVKAITAMLNPDAPKEQAPAKRTVKDIEADLEKAEEGPTDVTNAQLIQRLRAELAEAKGKK